LDFALFPFVNVHVSALVDISLKYALQIVLLCFAQNTAEQQCVKSEGNKRFTYLILKLSGGGK
jgi:hypothetical protein